LQVGTLIKRLFGRTLWVSLGWCSAWCSAFVNVVLPARLQGTIDTRLVASKAVLRACLQVNYCRHSVVARSMKKMDVSP
jgi:hypothetical protein